MSNAEEQKPKGQLVRIHIDRKPYESRTPITGVDLYALGGVDRHRELFKEISGDLEDSPIPRSDQLVDLESDDHFYSQMEIKIVVNGRKKETVETSMSFEDLVKLAFDAPPSGPNVMFTITYRNGPRANPEGTLVVDQRVKLKNGMVFNVIATDKS